MRGNPHVMSRDGWLVNPVTDDIYWFHGGARISSLSESAARSQRSTSAFYLSTDVRVAGFFLEMLWQGRPLCKTSAQLDVFRSTPQRDWPKLALRQLLSVSAITACAVHDTPLLNADQLTPPQVMALTHCLARSESTVDFDALAASYDFRLIEDNPALVACIRAMGLRGWYESESSIREGAALNMALLYPEVDAALAGEVDLTLAAEPALRRILTRQLRLISESI